jgi:uncharacterized protein
MKYLLLLILLGLVFFLLGVKRARPRAGTDGSGEAAKQVPVDMVACAHCGLHLPRGDALPGRGGQFCSAAHRASYEAQHAGPP